MNISIPIIMIIALLILLIILVFLLIARSSKMDRMQHRKIKPEPVKKKKVHTFDELIAVLKNKESGANDLSYALHEIIGQHGEIPPKLGTRPHPEFDNYMLVILPICRHPNTNKNIILDFDRMLSERNPDYKREISDTLQKGLNSRG